MIGTAFRSVLISQSNSTTASERLLRRHPDFGLTGEVRQLRSDFINGVKYLPVRFD
ncbi:hypothetical protein OHA37_38670 [Streptomyces sp. NBC_00335]|uniref:hypothetical protein n=1 Tax=unclassified Streptomyces TaxID=2593676 RepID=UPI00225B468B|nr:MULTISPECIES: hypothetical protein [unclassified Streptomyces]MCX5409765.1 hypothetical protein [Streptomyces sp. NBC_00086]